MVQKRDNEDMPLTTTDTAAAELEAMQKCLDALQVLERHSQRRAVIWLASRVESQGA